MFLDHIVHFIEKKPQEAVQHWRQHGFHAAIGGQHINWGTYNALLYLKDCYIEWLAVEKNEVAESSDHPLVNLLLHDGAGFGTICLRTDSIAALDSRLNKEGFETSGVLDAERRTDSGKLIKWKMLFVNESVSDELPSPFFIEWQEDDASRYESLRQSSAIEPANEELEMGKCVFGVHDIESSKTKWKKLLGGKLELENCRIEFKKTGQPKERLEEVHLKGGDAKLQFEEGVYFV